MAKTRGISIDDPNTKDSLDGYGQQMLLVMRTVQSLLDANVVQPAAAVDGMAQMIGNIVAECAASEQKRQNALASVDRVIKEVCNGVVAVRHDCDGSA